jgi:HK97 family phage prohead protease
MTESEIFYRAAALTPGAGRTVYGLVVPYNQTVEVRDGFSSYHERFAPGAFTRSIAERGQKLKLLLAHDAKRLPIGKVVELHEQPDGVHAAFEIAATRDGDDALEAVRSGVADAFSVGFRPIRHRREGDVIVRTEASLREISLVGVGNYPGAVVAGIRSETPVIARSLAEAHLLLLDL